MSWYSKLAVFVNGFGTGIASTFTSNVRFTTVSAGTVPTSSPAIKSPAIAVAPIAALPAT